MPGSARCCVASAAWGTRKINVRCRSRVWARVRRERACYTTTLDVSAADLCARSAGWRRFEASERVRVGIGRRRHRRAQRSQATLDRPARRPCSASTRCCCCCCCCCCGPQARRRWWRAAAGFFCNAKITHATHHKASKRKRARGSGGAVDRPLLTTRKTRSSCVARTRARRARSLSLKTDAPRYLSSGWSRERARARARRARVATQTKAVQRVCVVCSLVSCRRRRLPRL